MKSCVAICVGFFVVADLLLISRPWFLEDRQLLIAMALPLSQCSLAAIWATSGRADPYVRFAVPLIAAITSWYVLTRILPWGIGEPASAAWALAIATQTLGIVLIVNLSQRVGDFFQRRDSPGDGTAGKPNRAPFAIDLRTLMLWTTTIAIAFGFVQYGRTRWQWTSSIADWVFLEAMPIIGVFHALVAVLWLWALVAGSWQKRIAKTAVAAGLTGVLGSSMPRAVAWATGTYAMQIPECLVSVFAQSLFVAIAIGSVMIAGRQPATNEISRGAPDVTQ